MDLTVYGASGFVGGAYLERFSNLDNIWTPPRWSRRPDPYKTTDMLYLISTTHNYNVFTDPTLDVNTNLLVFTQTLDSWKRLNPEGTFNFVSSWFVYGDGGYDRYSPADEDCPCYPKGFYSITKYAAEQLLVSFAETFGLKYRILRLCNILGPEDKNVSAQKNALQYLLNKMKAGEPVDIYEKGDFYRNYMDIEDCVEAIRLVMLDGDMNTVYNIGTDPPVHFMDAINYIHQATGERSQINFIPQKEFHKKVQAKSFAMNCDKLYALGYAPKNTIYSTLNRLLR